MAKVARTRLTEERKRLLWSQQEVADQIGTTQRNISRWERGLTTPGPYFRAKLCGLFGKSAQELGFLPGQGDEVQLSAQKLLPVADQLHIHWLVPLPRNPFFTGREEILKALRARLGAGQALTFTQSSALCGLGGVGKTQIALEYAYRYALEYSAVIWIAAETAESITASLLHTAEMLQLPEREHKDQGQVIMAVQRWLSTHRQWLLIWDNIEDLAILQRFWPTTRLGAMLLTTRYQATGTLARSLDLLPMEEEEGRLFLLRRAKMLAPEATSEQVQQFASQAPHQYAMAHELATILGELPLALDQAGAYIEETRCGLTTYLALFRTRQDALLQRRGEGIQDHPASVSTTFTLAITAAVKRHPAVRDLLACCALLPPDGIPEELFCQGSEHLGALLKVTCRDQMEWDHLVGVACSYSLLFRQSEAQTLSLHRLVQAVLLDTMEKKEQEQRKLQVIEALDAVFPALRLAEEFLLRGLCDRLLPSALHVLSHQEPCEESLTVASLAFKAALALYIHGQYAEAEPLHLRSLQIREQILGPDHSDVASSLHALALLAWRQGKDADAAPLYLRALQIRERALGPHHPDVASVLNDLGNLSWKQGKYADAEAFSLRALQIRESMLGPDHPDVAYSLNNLIMIYGEQGKYADAEAFSLRALQIRESTLGPDHPNVAISLSNLGNIYREQHRYARAEPICLRALHILEQAQGVNHPDVGYPLQNLAELYQEQGRYAEAERLHLRTLQIWEQSLGNDHVLVAYPLQNLANLYRAQSNVREAETCYRRALSIREQQLNPEHPEIAESLHGLALLLLQQDRLSEALTSAQRALMLRARLLGEAHPKTIATRILSRQLAQVQKDDQDQTVSSGRGKVPVPSNTVRQVKPVSFAQHTTVQASVCEYDPLQGFLEACCNIHPRAWCRSADLWQTYTAWAEEQDQERVRLSRARFIEQLKVHGYRADRTNTTRISRGIAPVSKKVDRQTVTSRHQE